MLAQFVGVSSDSQFQSRIGKKKKQQRKRGGLGGIVKAGGGAVKAGGGGKKPSPADAADIGSEIGFDVADAAGGGDNKGSTKTRNPGAISTSAALKLTTRIIESSTGRYAIHPDGSGTISKMLITTGPYSGRTEGGLHRADIEGTQTYGSGYTRLGLRDRLIDAPGVDGKDFPFNFWPIVWGDPQPWYPPYLFTNEYGKFNDTTRPGGPLTVCTIVVPFANLHNVSENQPATYRLIADKASIELISLSIGENCYNPVVPKPLECDIKPYDGRDSPRPEEAVLYYRASSAVLSIDGYNNTGLFRGNGSLHTPIPGNYSHLSCMKEDIWSDLPLVDRTEAEYLKSIGAGHRASLSLFYLTVLLLLSGLKI